MKIIFKKSQVNKIISEQVNISYTPEKIDMYVQEALKDATESERVFNVYLMKINDLTVSYITENEEEMRKFLELIENTSKMVEKKHSRFYDIVDLYDFMDMPDNVKQLEKITEKLDNLYYDFERLSSSLDSLIEGVTKLREFYHNKQV